jgi:hypothetical protein
MVITPGLANPAKPSATVNVPDMVKHPIAAIRIMSAAIRVVTNARKTSPIRAKVKYISIAVLFLEKRQGRYLSEKIETK